MIIRKCIVRRKETTLELHKRYDLWNLQNQLFKSHNFIVNVKKTRNFLKFQNRVFKFLLLRILMKYFMYFSSFKTFGLGSFLSFNTLLTCNFLWIRKQYAERFVQLVA